MYKIGKKQYLDSYVVMYSGSSIECNIGLFCSMQPERGVLYETTKKKTITATCRHLLIQSFSATYCCCD